MSTDQEHMRTLTRGLPSKSAKMRALAEAGYPRADIARFMGTKYQFVRNVLEAHKQRQRDQGGVPRSRAAISHAETAASTEINLSAIRLRVGSAGIIALPAVLRNAMAVREGDALIASLEDGELHLLTLPAAVRRAQAIVRQFVPEGVDLVNELLEERRRESESDKNDG